MGYSHRAAQRRAMARAPAAAANVTTNGASPSMKPAITPHFAESGNSKMGISGDDFQDELVVVGPERFELSTNGLSG